MSEDNNLIRYEEKIKKLESLVNQLPEDQAKFVRPYLLDAKFNFMMYKKAEQLNKEANLLKEKVELLDEYINPDNLNKK